MADQIDAVPVVGRAQLKTEVFIAGQPSGEARITRGYRLPARYVIHAVGPVWRGGGAGEDALLASCYRNSLSLAVEHEVRSLAFPAISTGIYRFPADRAARIATREVAEFLAQDVRIERVVPVLASNSRVS